VTFETETCLTCKFHRHDASEKDHFGGSCYRFPPNENGSYPPCGVGPDGEAKAACAEWKPIPGP
jgi:hypothetical protein